MLYSEQRRQRLRLLVRLSVNIVSAQGHGQGVITDLSMRGCALATNVGLRLQEGAMIDIKLLVPSEESAISVNGVVRDVSGPRMGVEFMELTQSEKDRLSRFVFRLWKSSGDGWISDESAPWRLQRPVNRGTERQE